MPFVKAADAAQFRGVEGSRLVKIVRGTTVPEAQRIARVDPAIGFFFFCNEAVSLPPHGDFAPGDAGFFAGEPWPGSPPQGDTFAKGNFVTGYVVVEGDSLSNAGCFILPDGTQLFDFAVVSGANINADPNGNAVLYLNPQVQAALGSGAVAQLQSLGITVLLSVLGNYQNAGWSCFVESTVSNFVDQLAGCVSYYNLDGIDIDDEYSTCETNGTSLIMVTSAMKQAMPGKIISKALYDDSPYFTTNWNGLTLEQTLTYGWEMSYGEDYPAGRLQPYLNPSPGPNAGMQPAQLALGIWKDTYDLADLWTYAKSVGLGGMMVYAVNANSAAYLSNLSQLMFGLPTQVKPNCIVQPSPPPGGPLARLIRWLRRLFDRSPRNRPRPPRPA